MMGTWSRPSEITKKKFEPYALAIGQMALAWNDFHEALGVLFGFAMRVNVEDFRGDLQKAAIWGSITSDRQKRLILEAAASQMERQIRNDFPQLEADLLWLVKRGDSLEEKRNNIIHATLAEMHGGLGSGFMGIQVGDVYPRGHLNERSRKLMKATLQQGKELLREINLYRSCAAELTGFSRDLILAWHKPNRAWPDRPVLPSLSDKAKGGDNR